MTNELKRIKDAIDDLESSIEDDMQTYDETMKESLVALRKQVPMIPDVSIDKGFVCPSCNVIVHNGFEYCPKCGQRLKWLKWEE